jgi:hypothetical protein
MKFVLLSLLFVFIGCGQQSGDGIQLTVNGSAGASGFLAAKGIMATQTPSALKVKIYEVWASKASDCSAPEKVIDLAEGVEIDMTQNPQIGSGSIEDGTYECLIVVASDQIKVTPSTNGGSCTAGTEVTQDICLTTFSSTLPDGTTTTCGGNPNPPGNLQDDTIAIYVSRGSTSTGMGTNTQCNPSTSLNPFQAPTSANDDCNGVNLPSSVTVNGDLTTTFTIDVQNKLDDTLCTIVPVIEFN